MTNQTIKELNEKATSAYEKDIAEIKDYLLARGIDGTTAKKARLGYVKNPILGHEQYVGRLAIPYITPSGIVDIRFRCAQQHNCKEYGHPKYVSQPGHSPRLYGTMNIVTAGDIIAITEGELDSLILTYKCGIPAVGCAGVKTWKPFYDRIFEDFGTVFVAADGDTPGRDFGKHVAREIENSIMIQMPDNKDVTDIYIDEGYQKILNLFGLDYDIEETI